MFFLVILGLAALGGVIYMAISKKSSFKVRVAALCALAVMMLTVIICLILSIKVVSTPQQILLPDALPSDIPPPQTGGNSFMMIMFIVFLIGLFALVFVMAMREQKRADAKIEPPVSDW